MGGQVAQDIMNDAFGQLARAGLLLNNLHLLAQADIGAFTAHPALNFPFSVRI